MGGANSIIALIDNGIGIGVDEQSELVPIQRSVIELGLEKKGEQAQPDSVDNSGSRTMNARAASGAGGGNGGQTERVRYVNESEQED